MPRRIVFEIEGREFPATLHDTPTADAIWDALPLDCAYSIWGDEIYLDCGVSLSPEDGQETVALGDLSYWPPGSALCLFYGPTPMSGPGEIPPRQRCLGLREAGGRCEGAQASHFSGYCSPLAAIQARSLSTERFDFG